jgi:hypothetical protein
MDPMVRARPIADRVRMRLLLCFIAIFLVNDLANIFVRDYRVWLLIDYGFAKGLPLAMILWAIRKGVATRADFGIRRLPWRPFVGLTVLLSVVGIIVDQLGWRFLEQLLPRTQLGSWPRIEDPMVNVMDLILGLALVGIVEELLFRGFCFTVLRERTRRTGLSFLLATVVFGAIHWSLGLHAVVSTMIWAVMPLIVVWKTGSAVPGIIAHFLTNFVAFSNVIPGHWLNWIRV